MVKYDGAVQSVDISNVFDGSPSYWHMNPNGITNIVIELTLHRVFTWTNTIYIDSGSNGWRAKNVKIEVMNTNYANDIWSQKGTVANHPYSQYKVTFSHKPVGASNEGGGFNKIRLTFSGWNSSTIFRIAAIGVINYGSSGLRETFLPKDGGSVYGDITPYSNNIFNLGSSSNKWKNIYATTFTGALSGNASTATKATQDASGNVITSTYATKIELNDVSSLVGSTPVSTQITSAINDAGFLTADLNNAESGTVPFTNSDMLGGLPASSYLQVADFPQALADAGVVKSVAGKTPNASGEVVLIPADIGAAASEHTHDYVPTSRTVNGKALSSDISLTYSDVGAAAASHTHTVYSLQSIGNNPITSTSNDTTTNWGNKGTCVCFYSISGCLIDQPSQYGILVSFSHGAEVHQIWMTQASGKVYHRGGNTAGWSGTWINMVDANCFSLSGTTLTITTT